MADNNATHQAAIDLLAAALDLEAGPDSEHPLQDRAGTAFQVRARISVDGVAGHRVAFHDSSTPLLVVFFHANTASIYGAWRVSPDAIARVRRQQNDFDGSRLDAGDLGVEDIATALRAKLARDAGGPDDAVRGANPRPADYWWVNQSQSYEYERRGDYMWAPLLDAGGHTLSHWEAMAQLQPGDVVFHYARGAIRAVSTVVTRAELSPRPGELPENWTRDGRLVRVAMVDLEPPIPLAAIDLEARLAESGPFDRNGEIKQAYLFALSSPFARALLEQTNADVTGIDAEVETLLIEEEQVPPGLPGKALREAIERYAVDAVLLTIASEHQGCLVTEMSHNNPGYDMEIRCPDGIRYVEVKGTLGRGPSFLLSETERAFSASHAESYEIRVVWGIDLDLQSHTAIERRVGEVRPETHGLVPWKWQGRLQ